jgi:hypothetical protein
LHFSQKLSQLTLEQFSAFLKIPNKLYNQTYRYEHKHSHSQNTTWNFPSKT